MTTSFPKNGRFSVYTKNEGSISGKKMGPYERGFFPHRCIAER